MSWWGKIIGGTFGFMLGGPLGAMLGAAVGHNFDQNLKTSTGGSPFGHGPNQERIQSAFFTTVFSVMGHVAKSDGRISEDEIAMARSVMQQMSLNQNQTRVAMNLFDQGKREEFDLDPVIAQFKAECHRRRTLMQMFLEILLHAAYADGVLHQNEEALLKKISGTLGFSSAHFQQLERWYVRNIFLLAAANWTSHRQKNCYPTPILCSAQNATIATHRSRMPTVE